MTNKQGQCHALPQRKGYVALGSNLQSATQTSLQILNEALGLFAGAELRISQQSQWYSAPAFPKGNGPDYVNAVVEIESNLPAAAILTALHSIESRLGRTRFVRWGARVVDLDLLAMGDDVAPDLVGFNNWRKLPLAAQKQAAPDALILPHPRLQDRAFVLKPLAEIAPNWVHPVLKLTTQEMLMALALEDRNEIHPL